MNDSKTALAQIAAESGAKKIGERTADRALNAIIDFVKGKYGESQVKIGAVFDRYLENATSRYNQIRTLTTGTTPRKIIGENSLYVHIGLDYNGKEIDTSSVDPLLEISKNILILGTGGIGKSMLTRYLFLDTAEYEGYVPVLIELRRIGSQSSGELSILNLIYSCMKDFDAELPKDQFEYSLQLGKYLFLFDGFDEVKSSLAKETAEAIQMFSAKYPRNSYIVTSRLRPETSPLETFTVMNSMALNKKQAVDLASRIWAEDEKTKEFCRQLDEVLYERHKDFAENPLLLSMMFLTFMRNSSIPEHLSDFYKKAYEALYSAHDNQDKGCYRRDFQCKDLDENDFKRILARFCFQTYFKEVYEFSEAKILGYLQNNLQKLNYGNIKAANYLTDLRNVVCMIIKDGEAYRFSHRSFQAYFAAYYTTRLTDEQQKQLFVRTLSGDDLFWERGDYYTLLIQIESDRFAENALEDKLRTLHREASSASNPDVFLFKSICSYINIRVSNSDGCPAVERPLSFGIASQNGNYYNFNTITLFGRYARSDFSGFDPTIFSTNVDIIKDYASRIISPRKQNRSVIEFQLDFTTVDTSDCITMDERQHFYKTLVQCHWGNGIYVLISKWLDRLDAKRASLKSPSFIDDL